MSMPSIEAQPGKKRIPPGTKRIIVFDTNAYRGLTANTSLLDCRVKAAQLRKCEHASGVFVLASPTVIWELAAHLADTTDPGFGHCLHSLVALGEHAVGTNNPQGSIQMLPDADSTVCRQLFHAIPPDHEKGNKDLRGLVKHIVTYAPDLSDSRAQANIKQIASAVETMENQWLTLMQTVVAQCNQNVDKRFFTSQTTKEVRKAVTAFFAGPSFMSMWAEFMVEIHAAKVGYALKDTAELKAKAQIMQNAFSVPYHLMSVLLQKVSSIPSFDIASPKRKRWNFIWDSQLSLSVGGGHKVGGVPLFVVSDDHELLHAAKAAGCDSRMMKLDEYLDSVRFP